MKHPIFALALAASAVVALSGTPASAGHRHMPLFWNECGPGLMRHCFGPDHDLLIDRLERNRVTCEEAKWLLRDRGYTNIKTMSCGGLNHVFKARWKGKTYIVKVSQRHGHISSVKRVKS